MAGKNAACFSDGPSDFRLSPFHGVKIKNIELVMVLLTIIATYSKSSSRPVVTREKRNSWNLRITHFKRKHVFSNLYFLGIKFQGCKKSPQYRTLTAHSRIPLLTFDVCSCLGGQFFYTWRNLRANVLGLYIMIS